jgi:signal transduction histidine kinase
LPAVAAVVLKSIDSAVAEACTAYFLVSNRMREHITAALSHDLRNPLAVIRASASLILRRTDKPDVVRWGSRIVESVDRADQMIRDLLDASQVQAGERLNLQISHYDLAVVAHEAARHLTALHGEHFVVVAPESVMAHGAPAELRRAIENLGSNAVKYGAAAQPITITLKVIQGRAQISVHNHGSYIPAEDAENLFQAFRRTRDAAASKKPGWGIGLSIVRGVAEAHGGSVGVDSSPEAGTTFVIDIPLDARPYQPAQRST